MFEHLAMVRRFFVEEMRNPVSRYSRSYLEKMVGAVDLIIAQYYKAQDEQARRSSLV
jgi:hypothetical protein